MYSQYAMRLSCSIIVSALPCPSSVYSSPVLPMPSQNATSPAHLQSVNLSCFDPLGIPHLLPMFSKYTMTLAYDQSEYHLSNSCPVSTPSLLLMINQFTIFSAHVQSVHHLFCILPDSTLYHLVMSSLNATFPVHIQTVH